MVNPIPKFAKNVWSKWNIRGVILVSLFLQIVLIFMAPFRKRTRKTILVMLLWSTYLLADYTANFCVGLIANKYGDEDTPISDINDFLLAFWTPFLLLHLGGPDTITAFSLEDNELWLRHMLGLIVQVCLTGYVFLLTLPVNTLWVPTSLVFIAGVIKFAERTRSLQLASVGNFRQSMVRKPDAGPNYAKLMDEYKSRIEAGLPAKIVTMPEISDESQPFHQSKSDPNQNNEEPEGDKIRPQVEPSYSKQTPQPGNTRLREMKKILTDVEVVRVAYHYFDIFKGLVVDMIFSFHERSDSRTYFLKQTPIDALRVIEVELNFIYEAFFTKASVVFDKVGFSFRFLSVASVVAALVTFVFDQKHGCHEFDVKVTYTLLYGAVALDLVSLSMLLVSDHSFASFNSVDSDKYEFLNGIRKFRDSVFRSYLNFKSPTCTKERDDKSVLRRKVLCRRWSESVSGFNLISYCLNKRKHWVDKVIDYIGVKELVEQWKYEDNHPLFLELWNFIFIELERKSADADDVETIQRICSSRGEWVIQEGELSRSDLDKLMPYVGRNNVTFDQCLILWHIATDLLFYDGQDVEQGGDTNAHKNVQDVEQGGGNGVHENDQDVEQGDDNGVHKNVQDVQKGGGNGVHKIDQDIEQGGHNDVHKNPQHVEQDVNLYRDFSKFLSDYMLYLLIMQPTMMSAVRGIGQIRFQDTCAEAANFFRKRQMLMEENKPSFERKTTRRPRGYWHIGPGKVRCKKLYQSIEKLIRRENPFSKDKEKKPTREQEACKKLSDVCVEEEPSAVKGDRSKSVLFDACRLAWELNKIKGESKWKIIAQVWVELLSYAASNCIPITHVQQLSKGGEFISLVWLLMTHLGLAKQFQIKEGHARAKLIVDE
ncbi:hypothetical protein VNO77_42992 [Canavalia gladiata]|uniref:DUF4220 domain-containing protein n=1 Tax=Canavalia gladiata TaxID=3824 RepID=A0AAN9JWA4_CANGL